ncbi:MAG: hypothetical protein K2X27_07125 [Candidatus Obscuribacterales bacterium]|nr:hypothetical protein [Candidatus Obscuribacterales bacterium]
MALKRAFVSLLYISVFLLFCAPAESANLTTLETGRADFLEKEQSSAEKKAGLVPYKDEVLLSGFADFDKENLNIFKGKAVLDALACRKNSLSLYKGRVLFNCKNDLELNTPDASIKIRKGSIVYVYSTGESVLILNLHDYHWHSVEAFVDGQRIEIPPGRELLITRYANLSFDEARLCPGIWYRSVYELISKPALKVYLTQFSSISAYHIFPSVRKLASDKKTVKKLTKTFAAVLTVSRDRQSFRPNSLAAAKKPLGVLSSSQP